MQTKEYILTNATELFNRQGFTPTSLRELAAYLDMSDGNLRYHFKNKKMLVTAIYQQLLQELESSGHTELIAPERLLEGMRLELRSYFFSMYRYKFLFLESTLLFQQFASFKKAFRELFEARKTYFLLFVAEFKVRGLFNSSKSDAYYERLAEQIFLISDNWIRYIEIDRAIPHSIDRKVEHYIDLCMQLIEGALEEK